MEIDAEYNYAGPHHDALPSRTHLIRRQPAHVYVMALTHLSPQGYLTADLIEKVHHREYFFCHNS